MLLFRTLFTVVLLLSIAPAPLAVQPATTREPGITGRVLTPDGAPVTQGSVALMTTPSNRVNAAIDRTGHFRLLPDAAGWRRLFISVPGFAPHRVNVTVPSSRTMALPDITLLEATYFHARFVTTDGEPLPAGGLRRRYVDRDGLSIPDPLDHVREQIELDGSLTLGPLPAGQTLLAFDRPPALAQTRLRDLEVTGTKPLIEGGTIVITPGAPLQVEIVDGADQPVPRHEVWIEDAVLPSPLFFQPATTNEQGRATFERLAPGRYRVWTRTAERCKNQWLTISRLVMVGGGAAKTRLVIGGRASIRIMSALGPVLGRTVSLSPDARSQAPWQSRVLEGWSQTRRLPMVLTSTSSCNGATDGDGRVTMAPFPPGPAQVSVRLFNSTYIARLAVPESGSEMVVTIPEGLIPVRVTDQINQKPVAAQVIWVGGGGRVETTATANGDALLEGVGRLGGTLTISAREYQTLEGQFDETPETHQEVALMPSPAASVNVRVVNSDGEAISGAVVELLSRGPGDAAEFVAADARGIATFLDVPAGPLQFGGHAGGFARAIVRIAEDARVSIVISLKRAQ